MDSKEGVCSEGVDPRVDFFNSLAESWDARGQDPAATVAKLAEMTERLRLQRGEDLLEVGCGTAQITGWLAEQVAPGKVVAVDFAQEMLERANEKDVSAEFRCVDVCRDDLGKQCFDVVLCFHSFPHFRDPSAALHNLARTLRSKGRLLVMHLAGSEQINAFHDGIGGAVGGDHLPTGDAWEGLLAEAGLTMQEFTDREGLFFLAATLDN